MATFPGGTAYDPATGRPVVAQTLQVTDFATGVPVTPEGGPISTGALGGYGDFSVPDVDVVTVQAPGIPPRSVPSLESLNAALRLAGTSVLKLGADGFYRPVTLGAGTHSLTVTDGFYYPVLVP